MALTLYHADVCPYCVRTRLVLDGKAVPYDRVEVDLRDKPAWLRELNPRNRVPVIDHDGVVMIESEALDEYLDEVFPEPAMMPADPAGRVRVRALMRRFDDLSEAYYAACKGEPGQRALLEGELRWVEEALARHPYLAGEQYTLAEPGYWPWIVRLERAGVPLDRHPAIDGWCERLAARPEYAAELALM